MIFATSIPGRRQEFTARWMRPTPPTSTRRTQPIPANSAQTLASTASTRTDALNTTVGNLDQYSEVTSTSVPFARGRTALGPKGKADLDDLATKLAGEKGYIVEVQGYSRGGVQTSQAMADSVVRYLVERASGSRLPHLPHRNGQRTPPSPKTARRRLPTAFGSR